jgi:D-3-phosphoglycerate dehydrogenase
VRTFLPPDLLDRPHRLRAIVRHGTGLDMIPMGAATRQGIPVAYVPGANAQAVAEYVVGSFFDLARRFGEMNAALRAHGWAHARPQSARTVELAGKTVGIVGVGDIGRRIACMCARGLGMNVLGYQPDASRFPAFVESVPLATLLADSDFVTLNCPLTEATRHLIDAHRLALMKPTAFLVNTARGGVVDEAALVRVLRARGIAGAALDVYAEQPLAADHAFLEVDNLLLTPHVAALTRESTARMSVGTAEQILQLMRGERPTHLANPEVWATWPGRSMASTPAEP